MTDTKTKVALVTGASRGLGAAMALALAQDGWSVAVNYAHDDTGAAKVVAEIEKAGGRGRASRFDVTDDKSVQAGLTDISANLGPVEVLVNNATGPQPIVPIEQQTWADHLGQLVFFVKAPLILLQGVLPDWRARSVGRVVNIGSEVVDLGNPKFGHYVAAKAAMLGLTRSWANELGPDGINVNLVAPGWIPVERHRDATPEALDEYRGYVPLQRMGTTGDVAAMVAFLASSKADFITGQTFSVNGGRTFA